ncbi:Sulfur carrier protein FdhD [Moorella thermoacetica]|uniref:Sulfur carrier protein FdhD n=2 Tax=Neomoorella thermoacetica TaxID=1525 RepID=A0A1J5JUK0_NEOTH|nr:formate dehydrogenase accessory sulfurtransferase FdhD [Moorella thermoacetica]OIQ09144.1 protein FdhD [Moorella thermoacetica]
MTVEMPFIDYPVTLISRGEVQREKSTVTVEFPLQIVVNGQLLVNLLCTPEHMEELVTGFLYSEGIITSLADILHLKIESGKAEVEIKGEFRGGEGWIPTLTTGCGQNVSWQNKKTRDCIFETRISSQITVAAENITGLIDELQRISVHYRKTHGTHGAALADKSGIIIFREDIGRHNAIDKVAGSVLYQGLTTDDKLLLTTGRISSEILTKAARLKVPFLVSRSVPTDYAIQLGELLGITIVGFVRGKSLKVYSHNWRVN